MKISHSEKELKNLIESEKRFVNHRKNKKESAINRLLADKVPERLSENINLAFSYTCSNLDNHALVTSSSNPFLTLKYTTL